ncbi:MAG TPA: hypothetical protein V6C85_02600 [Allocoleopsis sp.]
MAKMSDSSEPVIYQLKVVLLGISPMSWRRLLVKSDSTIEDYSSGNGSVALLVAA